MINLTCPSCQVELEIDDGFRGGVCRCFDCGTLMTVPDAPEAGGAESLSRPESPDSIVVPADSSEFERTGEFFTASGKRVHLSGRDLRRVPVARKKRMGVRITVIAIMASIVLGMLGAVVFGMWLLLHDPPPKDPIQNAIDTIGYDPTRNPYRLAEANFMSAPIPAGVSVTLMTDSSQAMSRYLDYVKHGIWSALNRMDLDQPVQIVIWRDRGPLIIPSAPTPTKQLPRPVVLQRLQELLPGGGLAADAAFQRVMGGLPPDIIFLAVSRLPPDGELEGFAKLLKEAKTRLVVIHLDAIEDHPVLKRIAEDSGGSYMSIPGGQLQRWYSEYLDKGGEPLGSLGSDDAEEPAP